MDELTEICPNGMLQWTTDEILEHIEEILPQALRVLYVKKTWSVDQNRRFWEALSPEQESGLQSLVP